MVVFGVFASAGQSWDEPRYGKEGVQQGGLCIVLLVLLGVEGPWRRPSC